MDGLFSGPGDAGAGDAGGGPLSPPTVPIANVDQLQRPAAALAELDHTLSKSDRLDSDGGSSQPTIRSRHRARWRRDGTPGREHA
jgi:hypothetical protein